ncbi:hypothetical protein CKAH01_04406 [Colletotrichum kahawae]|uniref:Uncharacterized protein n=1 Tax=Colletotrichum kahawae TaxID=34407 RepID=A0AAD9YJM7_COLKA|nr:hypothetical protein CKAH01_04406 [Colletotrichum kahawae]
MQIKSLAILTAITGLSFVAAAPAPDSTQPFVPSYSDFPEGILPLDFSIAVEAGNNTLQRRDCPGRDIWSCISIMGQVCIWTCGFRNNFQCLVGCPQQAQSDCQDWC